MERLINSVCFDIFFGDLRIELELRQVVLVLSDRSFDLLDLCHVDLVSHVLSPSGGFAISRRICKGLCVDLYVSMWSLKVDVWISSACNAWHYVFVVCVLF